MAVARKPNTKANFERPTRLPNRGLRVLRVAWTILIMKNRTDLFAGASVQNGGGCRLIRRTASATCLTIEDGVRFWHVQMTTPRYESACGFASSP
jgi:hypothetical protein